MKKLVNVGLIAVTTAFLLIGCATSDDAVTIENSGSIESSNDVQDLKVLSKTLMTEFLAGDFTNLQLTMSREVKTVVTDAYLSQFLAGISLNQTIEEIETVTFTEQDNYRIVTVTVPLSSMKLNGVFVYDENSVLAGLRFPTAPLTPEIVSTADFEEIVIKVGADGFEMDGRLTLPKNVKKPPVVIIISGSGAQGMDGSLFRAGNAVHRDLAHGLAQEGIASIRYNDRYYQYGNELAQTMAEVTIEKEVLDDVFWIIDYASTLAQIDSENIYIIGHSLGGMLAPYVAQQSDNLKGFISLAGTPRKLEDISLTQNEMYFSTQGIPAEQAEVLLKPVKDELEKIRNLTKEDTSTILGIPAVYWYSLSQVTGSEIASVIDCPALILQGDKDFQVSEDLDYEYWKTLLEGNSNVDFMLFEGLNHLFMPSDGDSRILDVTEYNIPNNVSSEVIDAISNFIVKNQ